MHQSRFRPDIPHVALADRQADDGSRPFEANSPMATRRGILTGCVALLSLGWAAAKPAAAAPPRKPLASLPMPAGAKVVGFGHSFIQRAGWAISVDGRPRDISTSNVRGVLPWIRLWDNRFNLDVFADADNALGKNNALSGAFQGIGGDHIIAEGAVRGTISRTSYVIKRAPEIVYLDIGTNDISSGVKSADEMIERLGQQLALLRNASIWVVMQTITGRKVWPEGHPKEQIVAAANDWIKAQDGKDGVKVCDLTTAGFNHPGFDTSLFGGDVIHPNPKGAKAMATVLLPILQGMVRAGDAVDLSDAGKANLWPSFHLTGTDGGKTRDAATGTVASGHSVSRARGDSTAVCAKETADGAFEKQVITFTPSRTGTGDRMEEWRFSAAKGLQLSEIDVTAGRDWLESFVFVEASAWDGWLGLQWQMEAYDGAKQAFVARGGLLNPDSKTETLPLDGSGFSGWLKICRFQLPAGTPADRLRIDSRPLTITFNRQATGTGTIKISRPILRKAGDPRPAWNL